MDESVKYCKNFSQLLRSSYIKSINENPSSVIEPLIDNNKKTNPPPNNKTFIDNLLINHHQHYKSTNVTKQINFSSSDSSGSDNSFIEQSNDITKDNLNRNTSMDFIIPKLKYKTSVLENNTNKFEYLTNKAKEVKPEKKSSLWMIFYKMFFTSIINQSLTMQNIFPNTQTKDVEKIKNNSVNLERMEKRNTSIKRGSKMASIFTTLVQNSQKKEILIPFNQILESDKENYDRVESFRRVSKTDLSHKRNKSIVKIESRKAKHNSIQVINEKSSLSIFELHVRIIGNDYQNGMMEMKKLEKQKPFSNISKYFNNYSSINAELYNITVKKNEISPKGKKNKESISPKANKNKIFKKSESINPKLSVNLNSINSNTIDKDTLANTKQLSSDRRRKSLTIDSNKSIKREFTIISQQNIQSDPLSPLSPSNKKIQFHVSNDKKSLTKINIVLEKESELEQSSKNIQNYEVNKNNNDKIKLTSMFKKPTLKHESEVKKETIIDKYINRINAETVNTYTGKTQNESVFGESFLKKYNITGLDISKLSQEEHSLLKKLSMKEYSFTQEYNLFDELFNKKPHLNLLSNPAKLSSIFKLKDDYVPYNIEKVREYDINTNQLIDFIQSNQELLKKWKP